MLDAGLAAIARVGGSVGATFSFRATAGTRDMEWSADRQRRQTCGKGQERELHPDDLLKQKQTGPFLEDLRKGSALGQELWLWWGLSTSTITLLTTI